MIQLNFTFNSMADFTAFISQLTPEAAAKAKTTKGKETTPAIVKDPVTEGAAIQTTGQLVDTIIKNDAKDIPVVDDKAVEAQRKILRVLINSKTTIGEEQKAKVREILNACDGARNVTTLDAKYFQSVTDQVTAIV